MGMKFLKLTCYSPFLVFSATQRSSSESDGGAVGEVEDVVESLALSMRTKTRKRRFIRPTRHQNKDDY